MQEIKGTDHRPMIGKVLVFLFGEHQMTGFACIRIHRNDVLAKAYA
jgi:hypothetical protein